MEMKFGILTVGAPGSPILEGLILKEYQNSKIQFNNDVPDDQPIIEKKLIEWSSNNACNVIFINAGIGIARSGAAPKAAKAVIDKERSMLAMGILFKSMLEVMSETDMVKLVCGIKNNTLIINFLGNSKSVEENFELVKKIMPNAVGLLEGRKSIREVLQQTCVSEVQCRSKVILAIPAARDRQSSYPMLDISEALACIFKKVPRTKATLFCDFEESLHRILAEDAHASEPVPLFDVSSKDGYAVNFTHGATYSRNVRGFLTAGDQPLNKPLKVQEAVRICTGALIPRGADTVVQVEDTILSQDDGKGEELKIYINVRPTVKQNIRERGSDVAVYDKVLDKYDRVTPSHIEVMATVGKSKVDIFVAPKVAVISTGSELQNPQGNDIKPGHIRDSNKSTILALLKQYNYPGFDFGIVENDPNALKKTLIDAFKECNVIITTGGVSMGEFDFVKKVLLEDFEATIHFGRVNMVPGPVGVVLLGNMVHASYTPEMVAMKFGILTVSYSSFLEPSNDKSGPILERVLRDEYQYSTIQFKEIVPDDQQLIEKKLTEWSTNNACNVIFTIGGTGFASSDVTPEATKAVIDKEASGLVMGILFKSLSVTDMAMLSRSACGIKNKTLILNLPGSPKAVQECFEFVKKIIPHAVALLTDDKEYVEAVHENLQQAIDAEMQCKSKGQQVTLTQPSMRDKQYQYPVLEVTEALACIFKKVPRTTKILSCNFEKSLHRILAEDVHARDPLPSFNVSMTDGYAVKTRDNDARVRSVRVVGSPGDESLNKPLKDGEAIRISAGAPIPEGADAVVEVEDTELLECDDRGEEIKIEIIKAPELDQLIKERGMDIEVYDKVLDKYDRVTPAHIGIMATVGKTKVNIFAAPRVAVISIGSELQDAQESDLKPGHIRDSNKSTILALLKQHNYAGFDCGIVEDDPSALKKTLIGAFKECDVVITTGGEFDIVKRVLREDFGASVHFGNVKMKPGEPTTFATLTFNGTIKIVFELAEDPILCTVPFLIFVLPTLRHIECSTAVHLTKVKVTLQEQIKLDHYKPKYVRAHISLNEKSPYTLNAHPTGHQISSDETTMVNTNGLLIFPSRKTFGSEVYPKGNPVDAIWLNANI